MPSRKFWLSSSSKIHKHKPLKQPDKSIRLLTIQRIPNQRHQPVELTTDVCSTADLRCKYYQAISYTWKKHARASDYGIASQEILVDGQRMSVEENLPDFLRSPIARDCQEKKLPLFIDAICIDQNSEKEKRLQIPLMSYIYRNARGTIVWLGLSSPQLRRESSLRHFNGSIHSLPHTILSQLVNNNYWERMWVISELLLSSNVVVCIDGYSIPWDSLSKVHQWKEKSIVKAAVDENAYPGNFRAMLGTIRAKEVWNESIRVHEWPKGFEKRIGLYELMETFSTRKCKLLEDRIFALLPLAKDCHIQVSYCRSDYELFEDVVNHVFEDFKKLPRPSEKERDVITRILFKFLPLRQNDEGPASRLLAQKKREVWPDRTFSARVKDICRSLMKLDLKYLYKQARGAKVFDKKNW